MRITIELRRPARRSVALLSAVLLLGVPAVALADHQFRDVPNDHPFHNEISAIAKAGITTGFSDGGYHPSEPVTRQSMAAFMERGFGRVGLAVGAVEPGEILRLTVRAGASLTPPMRVQRLTITVPGATNVNFSPQQVVYLQGRVIFSTAMTSAKGCPCAFYAHIRDTATNQRSELESQTFETASSTNLSFPYSFDTEWQFAAPPGPRTYELEVGMSLRASAANAATFYVNARSSLTAMTFPFGRTGTSDPWPARAQNVPADADQLPERRRDE